MRTVSLIIGAVLAVLLLGYAALQLFYARSATALIETAARIRPHSSLVELTNSLGRPDYTFEAPEVPAWVSSSALGDVKRGTVVVYIIKRPGPKLLIIHLLPESGVQFFTWTHT